MKLTTEQKNKIIAILDSTEFKETQYADLSEEKRKSLQMFYTPAKICIQMIEKYDCETLSGKNILDPTCGSGNLLIACLIAGADSDKLFGNEYDAVAVELCRKRLNRCCDILGKDHIKDFQIHQGNALHEFALKEFREDYDELYFDGAKADCAKNRKLENEDYNAYLESKTFKKNCRIEYLNYYDVYAKEQSKKFAEQSGGFDWFNL